MKRRLFPALGGPVNATRGWPSGRLRPRSRSANLARSSAPRQFLGQRGAAEEVDVGLVDEVQIRFEMGEDVEQAVAERGDGARETAGKLVERGFQLRGVRGLDHSQNGLRAGEVDPTGEERPQREFARFGEPRTVGQAMREHELQERRRGDCVNLSRGLPGVRL